MVATCKIEPQVTVHTKIYILTSGVFKGAKGDVDLESLQSYSVGYN